MIIELDESQIRTVIAYLKERKEYSFGQEAEEIMEEIERQIMERKEVLIKDYQENIAYICSQIVEITDKEDGKSNPEKDKEFYMYVSKLVQHKSNLDNDLMRIT